MAVRLVVFFCLLFSTCAEPESGSWVWKRLWQPHLDGICSALCPRDEPTPCPTSPPEPTLPVPPEATDFCRENPKTLACQLVAKDPELAVRFYNENQWAFLREGTKQEDTPTDKDVLIPEPEQEREQEQVRDQENSYGGRKKLRERAKQEWETSQDGEIISEESDRFISQSGMTYGQRRYTSWSSSRSMITARPEIVVDEDEDILHSGRVIRGQFRPVTVKMNLRGQVMRSFRTHRRGGEVRRRQSRAVAEAGACRSRGKLTTPRRVKTADGKWEDIELYSFQVGRSVFQRFFAVSCVDSRPVTQCDCGGVCRDKFSKFVALEIYKDDNNDIKVRPRLVEVQTCCELVIPS